MPHELDRRIRGTVRGAMVEEFLRNSFHFPLANILIELVLEGPGHYLISMDFMASLVAPAIQAVVLGHGSFYGRSRPLLGNLIGPLIYSCIDFLSSPAEFISMPFHYAYWVFALLVGIIQELRLRTRGGGLHLLILVENLVRSSILMVMYWFIGVITEPKYVDPGLFMANRSHLFILSAMLFLGVIVGLEDVRAQRFLLLLQDTAGRLTTFSRWLLGRNMLSVAITDPASLTLMRRKRAVLFVDIRKFTAWSEEQAPEMVVSMLNHYYDVAEKTLVNGGVIQFKYTADEVMAFFATPWEAVRAAIQLRQALAEVLGGYGLQAGAGINYGPVVEGLFGSSEFKRYDIIGDTVNTAKRICSAAEGGELLISALTLEQAGKEIPIRACREIIAKGKSRPLAVHVVAG
jgi:class 3 adenylate cyclase